MTRLKRMPIYYLIFFIIMIGVNYLIGQDVGNVADGNETLIQPAGYAFSIWGLIYISLFVWIIRMFFVKNSRNMIHLSLQWLPVMNFALNSIWILVFNQEWILASNVVIIALWVTIYLMYRKVNKGEYHWLDRLPLSLYLGWVSLATVVNVFTWLEEIGATNIAEFNETLVVTIVLGVLAVLVALFSIVYHDWIIPLVGVWTYIAIFVGADTNDNVFFAVLIVGIVILLLASIINFMSSKKRYKTYKKGLL